MNLSYRPVQLTDTRHDFTGDIIKAMVKRQSESGVIEFIGDIIIDKVAYL